MTMADGWTIEEARQEFKQTGLPIDGLAPIIRNLPGFTPCGEERSGPRGGRGHFRYSIGELQRLHSALAPWLQPPSGDT